MFSRTDGGLYDGFFNHYQSNLDAQLETISRLEQERDKYSNMHYALWKKEDEKLAAAEKLKKQQEKAQLKKAEKIQQLLAIIQGFHARQAYQQALAHAETIDPQQRNLYLDVLANRMEDMFNDNGLLKVKDENHEFHQVLLSVYEQLKPKKNSQLYANRIRSAIEALSEAISQETDEETEKNLRVRRLVFYIKTYLYCRETENCMVKDAEALIFILANAGDDGIETENLRGKSFEESLAYLAMQLAEEKQIGIQLENLSISMLDSTNAKQILDENLELTKKNELNTRVINVVKQQNEKLTQQADYLTQTNEAGIAVKNDQIKSLQQDKIALIDKATKIENEDEARAEKLRGELGQAYQTIESQKASLDQLRDKLQKTTVLLNNQNEAKQKEMSRLTDRNATLLTEQQNLSTKNENLLKENKQLGVETQYLTTENKQLLKINENLQSINSTLVIENQKLTAEVQPIHLKQHQGWLSIFDQIQRDIVDSNRGWQVSWVGGHSVNFIEESHSNKHLKVSNTAKKILDTISELDSNLKKNSENQDQAIDQCREKILNHLKTGQHRSILYRFFHRQTVTTRERYKEYKRLLKK